MVEKTKTKNDSKNIETTDPINSLGKEIGHFVNNIESLSDALELTISNLSSASEKSLEKCGKFIDIKSVKKKKKDNTETFRIKVTDIHLFKQYNKEVLSSSLAVKNVPRLFLCSLVNQYDAYLGRLHRSIFFMKPELLNASQKNLMFSDLIKYSSIEDVREFIIEKEVESFLRESHSKQFEIMESRFGMVLRKDLAVWPVFIELTERRNLYVHCDGIVSSQYINVCKQNNVGLNKSTKVGNDLNVNKIYFQTAFNCIFEIGVKLGQVLWRKLKPDELELADNNLINITYELLLEERYPLAIVLLHFASDVLKKHSSDQVRCIHKINLSIAYRQNGDKKESLRIIKEADWSACSHPFTLAVAVLEDRYDDAAKIMLNIGSKGDVGKDKYSFWPLFKDFRLSKEFLTTYKKIFREEFTIEGKSNIEEQKKVTEKIKKDKSINLSKR